jgi:hypothetical protein
MKGTILIAFLLACGAAQATPEIGDGTLLKAINFALTGSDYIKYAFTERRSCVVSWTRPSVDPKILAVETFHINNIDASRVRFQKIKKADQFSAEDFVRVELHGESVIQENGFIPPVENVFMRFNDLQLDLHTNEMDRLMRAWQYIYAHGCKSGQSSF